MRLSMRKRILLAFLAFIVGPGLIAFVAAQRLASGFIQSRVLLYTSQLTDQITRSIDSHLVNYQTFTLQLYFNSELWAAASAPPDREGQSEEVARAFLQGFVNSDRYVSTAYLMAVDPETSEYGMDSAIVEGMPYVGVDSFLREHKERIQDSRGRLTWLPTRELQSVFGARYHCFGAVRPVRQEGRIVALLLLLFREDFFRERYRDVRLDSDETNYLVARDGTIVSSSNEERTGMPIDPSLADRIDMSDASWFLVTDEVERYIVHATSQVTNWTFINDIPRSALFDDLVPVRNIAILIGSLFVVFMVWLSLTVSRRITQPLGEVQAGLARIGRGDLTTRIPHRNNDDIGELAATVNDMVEQLEGLMQQVAEEERERQQERLRALQLQLSPHFLYNSLNTIRWMAIINSQDNIKVMIDSLIQLMKNIASPDTEFTTLDRELQLLRHYVYIQQMRYPNFTMKIEVPDGLKTARINKFVIQNLVENSIVHGFADRADGGVVTVSARDVAGDLHLEVADNGVGFDPHRNETRSDEEHVHTGLAGIHERIALVHGGAYGLEIDSRRGVGTRVLVTVPLILEPGDKACAS
ncbi:MAG: HAMP domain-containing protein [Spirochaetes bacterium]|jgi:sensor histidine kinase YesM|nr:HAMP domain-containing protein [Spirochaetota bacterium]